MLLCLEKVVLVGVFGHFCPRPIITGVTHGVRHHHCPCTRAKHLSTAATSVPRKLFPFSLHGSIKLCAVHTVLHYLEQGQSYI